jgi:hypothetical protein
MKEKNLLSQILEFLAISGGLIGIFSILFNLKLVKIFTTILIGVGVVFIISKHVIKFFKNMYKNVEEIKNVLSET